jgi:hypothetical protein
MKKVVFSLLLAVGVGGAAQAQMRLGVKAGASLATYSGTDLSDVGYTWGGLGGLTLNVPITSDGFFSVQPELQYSQKGYKIDGNPISIKERLHYLDLPVLARINADGLIFEAGPQLGYLATAKVHRKSPLGSTDATSTNDYNRVDVGYVAGVGYQLSSGPAIGLRYNGGITSHPKNADSVRNSVFQLFVGYTFGAK